MVGVLTSIAPRNTPLAVRERRTRAGVDGRAVVGVVVAHLVARFGIGNDGAGRRCPDRFSRGAPAGSDRIQILLSWAERRGPVGRRPFGLALVVCHDVLASARTAVPEKQNGSPEGEPFWFERAAGG